MALGKIQPVEPKSQEPTETEKLATEQERVRELEKQLEAQKAADAARREEYERALNTKFQQAQQMAAPKPAESAELYQAQKELGITDEDLAENPAESVRKIAEYQAQMEADRIRQGFAPVMSNLVRQSYKLQLKELSSDPFYEDVGPLVEQYFNDNPDELLREGRIEGVYYEIVGKNLPELQKRKTARDAERTPTEPEKTDAPPARKTPSLPSINTPPAGGGVEPLKKPAGPSLTEQEEFLMNIYNKHGADLDAAEWEGISKGKLLPKSRAADWQNRGRPEDAHVTDYEGRDFEPNT